MFSTFRGVLSLIFVLSIMVTPAYAESELIKHLLEQISQTTTDAVRPKLAVLDLVDLEGKNTKLGSHLAEGLLNELFVTRRFTLLERNLIEQVIKEQGFSQSALADAEQLIEIGRLSGAQFLLTGRYSVLPDQVDVTLRLLDTSTGEIVALSSSSLPKTAAMRHLNGELVLPDIVTDAGRDLLRNIQQNVPQLTPERSGLPLAGQAQRVFYEDFSRYASGTPLTQLGPHLLVRTSQRYPMHVLTSEHPAANSVSLNLPFPHDFIFEVHMIDTLIDPRQFSASSFGLMLIDQTGKSIMVRKQGHGFSLVDRPFMPSPWRYQDWNILAVSRQGQRMSLYLNGQLITEAIVPELGEVMKFHLLVPELRQWAFTRLTLLKL